MITWGKYVLITLCLVPSITFAEFLDDWANQAVYTGPNYFQGSKRSYMSFGGYSARWNNSSDYLVGITKPKWSAGCGGIDLFLGGFQFMEFEYLVQKLQQMMGPAAAALAYEVALSVISEKLASSTTKFSAIVDRLNQLQFDDCENQKTAVAVVKAGFNSEKFGEDATRAITKHSLVQGIRDSWNELKNIGSDKSVDTVKSSAGVSTNDMTSACPQDIVDIYFTHGWVLDHLVAKLGAPYNTEYSALLRGLIGDVFIDRTTTDYLPSPTGKCNRNPKVQSVRVDHFINGTIEKKDQAGTCVTPANLVIGGGVYANLRDYIRNMLMSITNSMITKTALSVEQEAFMAQLQGPVLIALEGYISIQGDDCNPADVAAQFVDFVGADMVYYMVTDFASMMQNALNLGKNTYDSTAGTQSEADQTKCSLKLSDVTRSYLDVLEKKLVDLTIAISDDYMAKRQVLAANMESSRNMHLLRNDARSRAASRVNNRMEGNPGQVSR